MKSWGSYSNLRFSWIYPSCACRSSRPRERYSEWPTAIYLSGRRAMLSLSNRVGDVSASQPQQTAVEVIAWDDETTLIAPTCDGEDVGEAWVAYQWAQGLAAHHDVTLLTYHKRGARPAAEQLSGLRVIEWTEPPLIGRAERLNSILKPGYVPFYMRARRWIDQALARGERFDVAHQPTPVAMRYPSPAIGFPIPLVIGPVGGGIGLAGWICRG